LPKGGNFTGNGILDNTSLFNPSLANANAFNKVTYQYIIEGDEFSLDEDIYVIDLPEVELAGDLQVCANTTDAEYVILGAEPAKYDYKWEFTGVGEIIDSTAVSVKVHWQANPASYTGMIRITLQGKNETECPAAFEYLVDIDPDDAPDKPCVCLGDVSRRLLLCSITTASYYRWHKSDGELIDSTETAYLYLTDDLIKYHDIGDLTTFYVSIANQRTGCYTRGDMCMEEKCAEATGINQVPGLNNTELLITVRNNPVHGELVINASGNYSGPVTMQVCNMNGLQVKSSCFSKSGPEQDFKMVLGSETAPGIYLLGCQYGNNRTIPVKLIVF
jgi:hypothetical protein